jgi:hypothetical protein
MSVCENGFKFWFIENSQIASILQARFPIEQERLASEKSKAVGSQQKRQRLCFRPPTRAPRHVWAVGSAVTAAVPTGRACGSAEAFLRRRNAEMRLGGFSISVCFSTTPTGTKSSRSCFKAIESGGPRRPPAPRPPLCFGLRAMQNPRSPSLRVFVRRAFACAHKRRSSA